MSPDPSGAPGPAPIASVVLPTRNRLHYLREAVASVLAQTLNDLELIIVDDQSTDETPEWLATQADARVSTVRLEQRLERSAARNAGLARVRGRYVLFLDDDDRLRPTSLALLVNELEGDPDAFVAAGRKIIFDDEGNTKLWPHPRRRVRGSLVEEVLFGWVESPGECLWRTEVLRASGGWREDLSHAEDQDLWLRLSASRPAIVVPDTVLEYRRHGAQARATEAPRIEHALREQFLADAPPELAHRAHRAVVARRAWRDALDAQERGDPTTCLARTLRAVRTAPWIVRSPLVGQAVRRVLLRSAGEALLGRRGRTLLHDAVWALRRRRGKAIEMQRWADEDAPPG